MSKEIPDQGRRRLLGAGAVTSLVGTAGCLRLIRGSDQETTRSGAGEATFTFEYDAPDEALRVTFDGGAALTAGDVHLQSTDGSSARWPQLGSTETRPDERLESGATARLGPEILNWKEPVAVDETIRVVHRVDDAPTTLARYTPATTTEVDESTETDGQTETDDQTETGDGSVVRESALVSRWPFDATLEDAAGDNHATAEIGSPAFGTYDGRTGMELGGDVGLMINTGENRELSLVTRDTDAFTIAGWVYFDEKSGQRDPNGDTAVPHQVFRNDAEYTVVAVPVDDDDAVDLHFRISGQDDAPNYNTGDVATDELTLPTNEWHHFAYVVEPADRVTFYRDGERQFRDDEVTGYSPHTSAYWSHETIGSWYGTGNPTWYHLLDGKLADLRIYDAGLSADEVASVHAAGR